MSFAGSVQKYLDRAIENGAAIVRMFPRTFRHSMKTWQVGDMLNSMQERRIPLMLWHTQVDWDAVQEICDDYNRLPIIIEGNDQKLLYHNRAYLPLMQHYDNLYMETHSLIQFGEIEHLVNEFGIHRLLFGSYMPYNTPDASMMTITHAGIDEETKHLIAHGNIERLIEAIIR
jgi:predicted TIM-barrel fold metal-dependent hydrolase